MKMNKELEANKKEVKDYLQSLDNPIYMIKFNTVIREYEEQIRELKAKLRMIGKFEK